MTPTLLILKTGSTFPSLVQTHGDFEDWIRAGLSATTFHIQVVDARHEPLPEPQSLAGVVITGSALHVYDRGPHVDPQIDLARSVFESSTPLFGSCWGLQVITTAAGGSVRRNPKGREIGFGRRIRLTEPGRGHPIFAGKDEVFDAVTIHLDEVETLAPNMHVLARNAFSAVQAAEVKVLSLIHI